MEDQPSIKEQVREHYAQQAERVRRESGKPACCGSGSACCGDPITSGLYADEEKAGLPPDAVAASLGCGNPTALAELRPGEIVLDLGSGGGIDVLLSARRVGPIFPILRAILVQASRGGAPVERLMASI